MGRNWSPLQPTGTTSLDYYLDPEQLALTSCMPRVQLGLSSRKNWSSQFVAANKIMLCIINKKYSLFYFCLFYFFVT